MKKSILIVVALGIATAAAVHFANRPASPAPGNPVGAAVPGETSTETSTKKAPEPMTQGIGASRTSVTSNSVSRPAPGSPESIAFAAAIDTLASAHSTYAEKMAAWQELQGSGRIQDAVAELEQRAGQDPQNAQLAAALGQAYLRACGTTQDVRAQAIWAMEADRAFDTALSADPANWDARYSKAMAMTYWPANLNKGPEIIDQFNTLIQQQEKEAPQPQFAESYDLLGQQYAKAGQPDLAQEAWQRGAALYPDNPALQSKLAPATAPQ
jgi:tetratricopeptide (TPR) repeat protein